MLGKCQECSVWCNLEEHHTLHGTANRKICDRYKEFKFKLCFECHRGTNGVHGKNGLELNLKLKKKSQKIFESEYGTREEFIKLFGRNYL